MKRNIIVAIVLLAFSGAVISGCTTKTTSVGSENVVRLKWYFRGEPDQIDKDEVYTRAKEMIQEKLGYDVDFNPISMSAYNDKMNLILASGEEFDLCWTANGSGNYVLNASGGSYHELDDLLVTETPALKELFRDVVWDATRVNGKIYGVPIQQIMASSTCALVPVIFYDKYKELLENVKTYEDFDPYIAAVASEYPQTANISFSWGSLAPTYGIDFVTEPNSPGAVTYDGGKDEIKVFNQFASEEFKKLVSIRKGWTDKGYTVQGVVVGEHGGETPQKTPLIITVYKPNVEITNKPAGFDVKAIKMSESYLTIKGITSTMYAVSSASVNPTAAMKFIEYINTNSDIANLLVYGIEGKHYEKLGDNTITVAPNAGFSNYSWQVGNIFNLYIPDNLSPDIWEQTKEMNETAIPSRLLGFTVDTTPIALELTNCNSIISNNYSVLQIGIGDTENVLQNMNEQLKKAGVDKIITEYQRQVDEWISRKD